MKDLSKGMVQVLFYTGVVLLIRLTWAALYEDYVMSSNRTAGVAFLMIACFIVASIFAQFTE